MATKRFVTKHGLDNNNQTITNVANPSANTDAANKAYVDNTVGSGLPSQTGNNGRFLTTSGTTASWSLVPVAGISATGTPSSTTYLRGDGTWATVASGSGTVTSVSVSGSNGIGISGSPITTSGTVSLSLGAITPTSISTGTGSFTGDVEFAASIKSPSGSNSPIVISPDGTGDLHVNADSLRLGDNNADATIATNGTGDLILTTNEGSSTEGVIRLYDGANGNITITPNGTGGVGIGKTPSYKLDVNGTINGTTFYSNGYTLAQQSSSYIQLFRQDGGIGIFLGGADPANYYDNLNHIFRDRSGGEWARLNSTGLGIGTSSISQKLTFANTGMIGWNNVNGTVKAGSGGSNDYIALSGDGGTDHLVVRYSGNVGIGINSPSTKLTVKGVTAIGQFTNGTAVIDAYGSFAFYGCNAADNGLRISPSGDVGIGFNPSYKLDVNGNARTTGRFYSNEWVQFDNYTGIYSPINSAYIYPNPNSYGSWKVEGQRNGWCGLEFATTSNGNVSLMIQPDAGTSGFHNNSVGWQFRWNVGTLYCHKGTYGGGTVATVLDSSNYTSYVNYGNPNTRGVYEISNWNQTTYPNAHFLSGEGNIANSPTTDFHYGIQTSFHRSGNAYRTQFVTSLYSDTNIYARNSRDGDVWTSWKLLLHSGNFSSYAVVAYGTSNDNIDANWGQSFKTFDPVPSGTPPVSSPNIRTINIGDDYNRRTQLAFPWDSDRAFLRRKTGGSWTSWVEFLTTSNYTSYTLNRNGDNTTGIMYFTSNKGNGTYLGGQSNYSLQAYSDDGGAAAMSFHRAGLYAVNMGLDPDNIFRIGGWSASANRLQLDMSGNLTVANNMYANSFAIQGDTNNQFTQGGLQLRGSGPTIYFRDTDHNSAMLHCNSNIFYILRGGNDTTTWATTNGYWPLEVNLSTNDATFGRHIYAPAGYIHAVHFNQTSANSENPTVDQVIITNGDNYFRKASKAHFKAQTGMYHNDGTSTANRIIISTSTPTGTLTNGDVWLQY